MVFQQYRHKLGSDEVEFGCYCVHVVHEIESGCDLAAKISVGLDNGKLFYFAGRVVDPEEHNP